MKKIFIFLCAVYLVVNQTTLSAGNIVQECYYVEPIEQRVDEIFFKSLFCNHRDTESEF